MTTMNTTNNMSAINALENLNITQQEAVLIWVAKKIFGEEFDNYEVVRLDEGLDKAYLQAFGDDYQETGFWINEPVRSEIVNHWVKELLGKDTDGDFVGYQLQCEAIDSTKKEASADTDEVFCGQTMEEWLEEDNIQEMKTLVYISVKVTEDTIALFVHQDGNEFTVAWDDMCLYNTTDEGWKALMANIAEYKRLFLVSEDWHYPEEYPILKEEPICMGGFAAAPPLPYEEDVPF